MLGIGNNIMFQPQAVAARNGADLEYLFKDTASIAPTRGAVPLTFTRTTSSKRVNALGLDELVGANVPRFDYDPDTLLCRGLLFEGNTRTNLLFPSTPPAASSGNLLVGTGIATKVANTPDVLDPRGGNTATAYTSMQGSTNSGGSTNLRWLNGATAAGPFSFQIKLRTSATSVPVSLRFVDTGAGLDTTIPCGSTSTTKWKTFSASVNVPAGSTALYVIVVMGPNSETTYVDDGQLEAALFSSSHIPTTTGSVARAADSLLATPIGNFLNSNEGTLIVEAVPLGNLASSTAIVQISDSTSSNRIGLFANSGFITQAVVTKGGVNQTSLGGPSFVTGSAFKFGISYMTNNVHASFNGATLGTDLVSDMPAGLNTLLFGPMYMTLQAFRYFRRPLTVAELNARTL